MNLLSRTDKQITPEYSLGERALLSFTRRLSCSTVIMVAMAWPFSLSRSATPSRATGSEEIASWLLDYILGSLVTLGLLVYLTYALLRPERF